jgi:hypothetical protein
MGNVEDYNDTNAKNADYNFKTKSVQVKNEETYGINMFGENKHSNNYQLHSKGVFQLFRKN